MIAVIFEVWIKPERRQDYLAIAQALKSELETIDGFISVERFQSLTDSEKLLSLSIWRDEDSVSNWRNHSEHRIAQKKGRESIFNDYRLRVVSVIRDYGMNNREQAP